MPYLVFIYFSSFHHKWKSCSALALGTEHVSAPLIFVWWILFLYCLDKVNFRFPQLHWYQKPRDMWFLPLLFALYLYSISDTWKWLFFWGGVKYLFMCLSTYLGLQRNKSLNVAIYKANLTIKSIFLFFNVLK